MFALHANKARFFYGKVNTTTHIYAIIVEKIDKLCYTHAKYTERIFGGIIVHRLTLSRKLNQKSNLKIKKNLHEINLSSRHHQIYEALPVPCLVFNPTFKLIDANEAACSMVGLTDKEELLANSATYRMSIQPCGTPSEERMLQIAVECLNHKQAVGTFVVKHIEGHAIVCDMTVKLVNLGTCNDYVYVAYLQDISILQQTQNQLSDERTLNTLLVKHAPMAINIFDNTTHIPLYYNGASGRLFEVDASFDKDEHAGDYFPELQPDGRDSLDVFRVYKEQAKREGSVTFEFLYKSVQGNPLWLETTLVPVYLDGAQCFVEYMIDQSDIHEARKDEKKQMEIIQASNRAKSDFLARISHEIRTPISAVMGIADIQLQDTTLPDHLEMPFYKIRQASQVLLRIINDLLDLSKIEAGKLDIIPTSYDMVQLSQEIIAVNAFYRANKPLELSLTISPTVPKVLYGDTVRIKQIVGNVLSNAFKYSLAGQITLDIDVQPDCTCEGEVELVITVTDTGIGMSQGQVSEIYDAFSRFHESTHSAQGTGLGMPIVFNLLDTMGGNVTVQSELGQGTTVKIFLPQAHLDKVLIGEAFSRHFKPGDDLSPKSTEITQQAIQPKLVGHVLVVDDSDSNLYVAKGLLELYGLTVTTCLSADQAISRIKKGASYDLILMDYMMPGLDGIQALETLHGLGYSKPVVVFTASTMLGQRELFLSKGFDDFLSKPIQSDELSRILAKFLDMPSTYAISQDYLNETRIFQKIQTNFIKQNHQDARLIRQHMAENQPKEAHRIAHTLKGLAGLLREEPLALLAREIEITLLETQDNTLLHTQLDALDQMIGQLVTAIEQQLCAETRPTPTQTLDQAHDIIQHLKPLLAKGSTTALGFVDELKSVEGAEALIDLIENFEFEAASEWIKEQQL